MMLFVLIELLLIFGRQFAKFHVYGPVHLYDLLFLLLSFWAAKVVFQNRQKISLSWPIVALIGFGVAYVVYSYLAGVGPTHYIIRHFAIFVYLIGGYIIFLAFASENSTETTRRFIVLVGIMAVVGQIITHFYNYITIEDYPLFGRFNYLSYMAVLGIMSFSAYNLVYQKRLVYKITFVVLSLFLSLTLGHASAFLATAATIFIYIVIRTKPVYKLIGILVFTGFIVGLYMYWPQFTDHNASWRIIYWKETLEQAIFDNYALIGNGFGVPLVSEESVQVLNEAIGSKEFINKPEERYLSPMHNSFITIIFHIGLVPSLLLFLPLLQPLKYILWKGNKESYNSEKDFLILVLVGCMVWASFNVVLELPHVTAFFWLVYFSVIHVFEAENKVAVSNLSD